MGHRVNATISKQSKLSSTKSSGVESSVPSLDSKDVLSSMSSLPGYSVLYREAQTAIFSDSGALPVHTRHYIAMMAASVAGCSDLASLERSVFISSGGAGDWLRKCPAKLVKLEEVNMLLCRNPRLIKHHHIKNLTDGEESFSISEIMQALVILIHTHALSTFVLANSKHQTAKSQTVPQLDCKKICERKSIEFLDISDKSLETRIWKRLQNKAPAELKRKRSFSEGDHGGISNTSDSLEAGTKRQTGSEAVKTSCQFEGKCSGDILVQDYSWDEHGYSVLSTFYQELAVIFDDKFRNIKSMINNRSEEKNSKLFTAAWYFVQYIFGVHHDDFNYQEIDQVLDQNSQEFFKLCCNQASSSSTPSSVKLQSSSSVFTGLSKSQQLELSVVLMEARFLSEILFATQSVMKHMA